MPASKEYIMQYLEAERMNDELIDDSGIGQKRFSSFVDALSGKPPKIRVLRNTPETTLRPFKISLDDLP